MKKRRPLTFSAGIINIVAYSIYILLTAFVGYLTFITVLLLIDFAAEADASVITSIVSLVATCIIRLALAITSIVMSAKLLKISKASVKDYNSAKAKLMSVVVINFIIVIYGTLSYITSGISSDMLLLSLGEILMFVAMLVVAIMLIVDMNNNKKAEMSVQPQYVETSTAPAEIVEPPAETATAHAEPTKTSNVPIEELEKLNQMKSDGLITEEEYEKMKTDILNK